MPTYFNLHNHTIHWNMRTSIFHWKLHAFDENLKPCVSRVARKIYFNWVIDLVIIISWTHWLVPLPIALLFFFQQPNNIFCLLFLLLILLFRMILDFGRRSQFALFICFMSAIEVWFWKHLTPFFIMKTQDLQ